MERLCNELVTKKRRCVSGVERRTSDPEVAGSNDCLGRDSTANFTFLHAAQKLIIVQEAVVKRNNFVVRLCITIDNMNDYFYVSELQL